MNYLSDKLWGSSKNFLSKNPKEITPKIRTKKKKTQTTLSHPHKFNIP